jgi:hypothetical protein
MRRVGLRLAALRYESREFGFSLFRDELSLRYAGKVAEEWSSRLLCCARIFEAD